MREDKRIYLMKSISIVITVDEYKRLQGKPQSQIDLALKSFGITDVLT